MRFYIFVAMTVVKGNDIPDLNSALAKILRVVIIICRSGIVYVIVVCLILMFAVVIFFCDLVDITFGWTCQGSFSSFVYLAKVDKVLT